MSFCLLALRKLSLLCNLFFTNFIPTLTSSFVSLIIMKPELVFIFVVFDFPTPSVVIVESFFISFKLIYFARSMLGWDDAGMIKR